MNNPGPNIAASVRQRLLNRARERSEDYGLLLTKFALERLLYRISQSPYRRTFILKGALLFELWTEQTHRSTRDADFLAHGDNNPARFAAILRELCEQPFENDGLLFDPTTVKAERIREEADYEAVRVTLLARLAGARIPIQIDIGFGDAITPAPKETAFPTLLNLPQPVLLAYPKESVVAEKFEAMVKLGIANSRMKDFYDLRVLAEIFAFDGGLLAEAIRRTFDRRKTVIPDHAPPLVFTPAFLSDDQKNLQWDAFIAKNRLYVKPVSLQQSVSEIQRFLTPLITAPADEQSDMSWQPNGPWERISRK